MPKYCELADYGLIGYSGDDARTFLHNQLTCDVEALDVRRSAYGSYCTPKGRILATFLLWRTAEGYTMQLPATLRESIQKRLAMYVLRSKVKVEDVGPRYTIAGVSGADATSHLQRIFGAVPPNEHQLIATSDATVVRLPGARYEVLLPKDSDPATVEKLKTGTDLMSPDHWSWLDIRAGVPVITPPTQEQFVPQMVNMDLIGGLSFSKGCYPGQEIVARTHFLGRLKQRMYLAHLSAGEPRPGDKLYSADLGSQASGTIVNAAPAPEGGFDALAAMQIAAAKSDAVHWKAPDGPELKLLPLPYEVTSDQ
ncbi:MAG TPA: folate-binding protein YgfZ [Burkholderiales bacterium]|nr:folate-binding protein YgfZ [Burkholderiales bacterium]